MRPGSPNISCLSFISLQPTYSECTTAYQGDKVFRPRFVVNRSWLNNLVCHTKEMSTNLFLEICLHEDLYGSHSLVYSISLFPVSSKKSDCTAKFICFNKSGVSSRIKKQKGRWLWYAAAIQGGEKQLYLSETFETDRHSFRNGRAVDF